ISATIRTARSRSSGGYLLDEPPDMTPSFPRTGVSGHAGAVHYRRAVRARGHFPNEQSALKTLYLVTRSLDPKGTGQTKWAVRWKPALNALAITFADRMPAAEER
ncbi:transposase, partial [Mycobacterium tuberculosis]